MFPETNDPVKESNASTFALFTRAQSNTLSHLKAS
jgi:hypothetical protein